MCFRIRWGSFSLVCFNFIVLKAHEGEAMTRSSCSCPALGTNSKSNARGTVFTKGRGEWHYLHGDRCFQWMFGTCPGMEGWKEVEEYSSGTNGINKCLEVGERKVYVKLLSRDASKQRTKRGDRTHLPGPMDSQSWFITLCLAGSCSEFEWENACGSQRGDVRKSYSIPSEMEFWQWREKHSNSGLRSLPEGIHGV